MQHETGVEISYRITVSGCIILFKPELRLVPQRRATHEEVFMGARFLKNSAALRNPVDDLTHSFTTGHFLKMVRLSGENAAGGC